MERHGRKTFHPEKFFNGTISDQSRAAKAYGEALLLAGPAGLHEDFESTETYDSGYHLVAPKVLEFLRANNKTADLKRRHQAKLVEHLIRCALADSQTSDRNQLKNVKRQKAVVLDLTEKLKAARLGRESCGDSKH